MRSWQFGWVLGLVLSWVVAACDDSPATPDPDALVPDAAVLDVAIDAVPVDPMTSSIVVDRVEAISGVEHVTVTVTLRDRGGLPLVDVAVVLVANGSGNELPLLPRTDAQGVTSGMWTSTRAEAKTISASIGDVMIPGPTVMFAPGPAAKLGFGVQPSNVIAGGPFSPSVRVEAQDAFGNPVDGVTGYVVLGMGANPGSTSLRGTATLQMQAGAVTFPTIHVDVAGTGYTLRARFFDGTLSAGDSDPFDVAWGDPALSSTVVAAPTSLEANGVDTTQVTMRVANAYNVAIPGVGVALSVSGSNNTLGASMGTTNAQGQFATSLSSTTAELKTVTGAVGAVMVSGMVTFHGPSCRPSLPGPPMTTTGEYRGAVVVQDVDADGARDVLFATSTGLRVYRGRGDGTFHPPLVVPVSGVSTIRDFETGDFNGDGHVDLVVAADDAVLRVLLGSSTGLFPTTVTTTLPVYAWQIVTGDVDNNGTLDVVISLPNAGTTSVWLGVGNGTFTAGGSVASGGTPHDLAVLDLNLDGKLDLVMSHAGLSTALGVGDGTFQTPVRLTLAHQGRILAGDLHGDGLPDVALGTSNGSLELYRGNGDGTLTPAGTVNYRPPGAQGSIANGGAIQDLDGDGLADIVVGVQGVVTVLAGDGSGAFTQIDQRFAYIDAVADMTGDGIVDVIGVIGDAGIAVSAGTGTGAFVAPQLVHGSSSASNEMFSAVADFNGDSRQDYVRWTGSDPRMVVMLTQADGSIVEALSSATTTTPYDVVAGDFTGDGHPDIAMVEAAFSGVTLGIAVGDGTGALSSFMTQNLTSSYATELEVADFDQDGRDDLLLRRNGTSSFWIARSLGTSFATPQPYDLSIHSLVVRDVNGDGFPDVVVATGTEPYADLKLFLGTGSGTLSAPTSLATGGLAGDVEVGDMTGDGVPDLVFVEGDNFSFTERDVRIFPGLGSGAFGAARVTTVQAPVTLYIIDIGLFDITEDGHTDLVVPTRAGTMVIGGFGDGYVRQRPLFYAAGFQSGALIDPVVHSDHDGNGKRNLVFWSMGLMVAHNLGCVP